MNFLSIKTFSKIAAGIGMALIWSTSAFAAGLMTPKNSSLDTLEIKEHHVDVVIADGYAITSVEQTFYNPNSTDLEALYSFPIPEKAAVGEFIYWIDGKPTTGEVLEKKKARQAYEEEKKAGRDTAITEQDSYKTFDISVSLVRSQQDVRIKLTYIQPTHVDTGIGRYVYPLEDGGVDEEKLSFWNYSGEVKEKFSFQLRFRSSYPVDLFRLPDYPHAQIRQLSEKDWTVSLLNNHTNIHTEEDKDPDNVSVAQNNPGAAAQGLDKDIVVYWRHKAGVPGSVDLVTHREPGKDRGTFMMTVTPGDDLSKITEGRDWVFVLDYSGSMQGKYQSMVEGVNKGLHKLNPNDRFRIFTFSDNAREITRDYVNATRENVAQAISRLEQSRPNGSTNLYDGLKMGTRVLNMDRSSAIILVTDGVANVGTTEKKAFLDLMEKHDVRLFTFVMGNSANRPLLEGMAKVSNGFAVNISNSDDIVGKLMEATSKLNHQAFHDVKVTFDGIKIRNMSPEKIGSLYRGQQLIVFGHYWGNEDELNNKAKVTIQGKISGQVKTYSTEFTFPQNRSLHPEIERLWAYASIEDLEEKIDYFGEDSDTKQAITDIAIAHGLVTNYTSMVVMRDEAFANRGIDRTNAKRVEKEHNARKVRQAEPTENHRVDQNKPMYNNPAPSHSGGSGGGAMGPWILIFMMPLLLAKLKRRHG